jgi:hypothetical protein
MHLTCISNIIKYKFKEKNIGILFIISVYLYKERVHFRVDLAHLDTRQWPEALRFILKLGTLPGAHPHLENYG